jgi:hypothetical protein
MSHLLSFFSNYGWRMTDTFQSWEPWRKKMGLGPHRGIDLYHPGRYGHPIYSPVNGKVTVHKSSSYGNWLKIITPSGVEVRTAHHEKIVVKNGQEVRVGDMIATNGSTGDSTGPHIHLEVLLHGKLKDPATFVFSPKDIKEVGIVEKLILIWGDGDRAMGGLVEAKLKAPVIVNTYASQELLDNTELLVQIGGPKRTCKAKEHLYLSGANRFETARIVLEYIDTL